MKILRSIPEIRAFRCILDSSVGLVPTMGFLHQGHLSLVEQSKLDNSCTIASIFVNPTQFGPTEDYDKYPRDEQRDIELLAKLNVDAVFIPPSHEMYPPAFASFVDVGCISDGLEGARRAGHFRGVATICTKLFNVTMPTKAYFGQKDAQQVQVIKKLICDLNMDIEIVVMPTVRENDGLALSSRNIFLNTAERKAAVVLHKALLKGQELFATGQCEAQTIIAMVTETLQSEPLANIDYVAITDAVTLQNVVRIDMPVLLSLAVYIGKTRLIDNISLSADVDTQSVKQIQ